jgi:tetratricopeptide (TPR) repeat protein
MDTGKCAGTSTRCHLLHLARRRRARRRTRRELIAYHTQLTFLPDLAASLNNQSNTLSDLGRREETQEAFGQAAGIYRQLAQDRPGAFLPGLAMALNNLAAMLSALGRDAEASAARAEAQAAKSKLNTPPANVQDALAGNRQTPEPGMTHYACSSPSSS